MVVPPAPTTPAPSAKRRGVLLPVAGLVALSLCALITIGIVEQSIGPVGVLVGTLCAMLPVVPVVATFLWVDRWEPEPPRLLLAAFAWGAGLSALVALLINSSASAVLDAAAGRGAGDLIAPVVVAPIVEEGVKGLFIVGLLVFRRKEFDGVVDGIVYAGVVAAGFAFTENILYLGRTVAQPETAGVLATLFMRGVASPFAHPLFTCMIGIGAGLAVASRSVATRAVAVLVGFVVAVVLHALWNAASVLSASPATFFQIYAFVMLPMFAALIVLVIFARRREAAIVTAELPGFAAAGWIAPSEVPLLADLSRRRGWRALVQRRSGRAAARAVAEYQAAVTELAFMRARIARGTVRDSAAAEHEERLRAVLQARAKAVGMPDALTSAWRLPPPPGWQPPPPPESDGSYTQPVRAPQGPTRPGLRAAAGTTAGLRRPGRPHTAPARPGAPRPGASRPGPSRCRPSRTGPTGAGALRAGPRGPTRPASAARTDAAAGPGSPPPPLTRWTNAPLVLPTGTSVPFVQRGRVGSPRARCTRAPFVAPAGARAPFVRGPRWYERGRRGVATGPSSRCPPAGVRELRSYRCAARELRSYMPRERRTARREASGWTPRMCERAADSVSGTRHVRAGGTTETWRSMSPVRPSGTFAWFRAPERAVRCRGVGEWHVHAVPAAEHAARPRGTHGCLETVGARFSTVPGRGEDGHRGRFRKPAGV